MVYVVAISVLPCIINHHFDVYVSDFNNTMFFSLNCPVLESLFEKNLMHIWKRAFI